MKNIHWLVPHKVKKPKDISLSKIASIRLRASLFNLSIFNRYRLSINEFIDDPKSIDYLFVSKFPGNRNDLMNDWLELINNHRKKNKKLFFDYTDHHLTSNTLQGEFYRQALKPDDHIITSSVKLKNYLIPNYRNISIIEDPIDINIQKIKKNKNSLFLFFGHPSNLKYLFALINNWSSKIQTNLIIQTSIQGINEIRAQSNNILKPPNLNIQLQLWSIENMLKTALSVSGVIIPGDIKDERKNGVSHNRLITAFALGLPVAAPRYESYLEFNHQFVNIDNKIEFENFLKNPSLYLNLVEMAQKRVKNFTKEIIAKKWLDLIE